MKKKLKKRIDMMPGIRINPALNKYDDIIILPEKLKMANEQLAKAGYPNLDKKPVKKTD